MGLGIYTQYAHAVIPHLFVIMRGAELLSAHGVIIVNAQTFLILTQSKC